MTPFRFYVDLVHSIFVYISYFMKIIFSLLLIGLFVSVNAQSGPPANLFTNGSFNGIVGEDKHGEGWNPGSTPDLNDTNGTLYTSTGYVWVGKPQSSKDGGTWQNLYSYREFLEQRVALEKGETYTIIFEFSSMPIAAGTYVYDQPVGIDVYIDDEIKFTTPLDKTPYTWETVCFQFKASLTSHLIKFAASAEQYAGIDGVKIIKGDLCSRKP